jgi:ABC-2 type transport system permease protein
MYFISFLLTCVSFLRERSSGTLERIESTALRPSSLILGYLLAFMVLTLIQGGLLLAFMTTVLGIKTAVSLLYGMLPMLFTVAIGVSMGIFFSTLAENEFQVIQFIPMVIIPQILLCGTLFEVDSMPVFFRYLAKILPLTYTNNFLADVLLKAKPIASSLPNMAVLSGFFIFFTVISILSIRKRH